MTAAGHPAGGVPCDHAHIRPAMNRQRPGSPARPLRLAGLTHWLRGVMQRRFERVASSPGQSEMESPARPEFVDTEAGWHTA